MISMLVLLGYLTITITNIFHHHHYYLNGSSEVGTPKDQNAQTHHYFGNNTCVVYTNFNSIHNLIVDNSTFKAERITNFELLNYYKVINNSLYEVEAIYLLRAPPPSFS